MCSFWWCNFFCLTSDVISANVINNIVWEKIPVWNIAFRKSISLPGILQQANSPVNCFIHRGVEPILSTFLSCLQSRQRGTKLKYKVKTKTHKNKQDKTRKKKEYVHIIYLPDLPTCLPTYLHLYVPTYLPTNKNKTKKFRLTVWLEIVQTCPSN